MGSQNGQTEQSWKESRLSLGRQSSTKGYGWKLQIQSCISRIAVQQVQSKLHLTKHGMEGNRTYLISESLEVRHTSTFQRKSVRSLIHIHTREFWSAMEARTSTRYGI